MAQAVVAVTQRAGQDYGDGNVVAKNIFYLISSDSNTTSPSVAPLKIPLTGNTYSYEIYLQFRLDLAPVSKVFNFKVWTDSVLESGYTITINDNAVSTYNNPINIESTRGNRVDFMDYDSENNSISVAGELTDIGDTTDFIVLQVKVAPGALPLEEEVNLLFQYDEI